MSVDLAVDIDGVRVAWDEDALRDLAAGASDPAWRLDGEPDWGALESLRVVSAAFEDGSLLALAAPRPAGAGGHDAHPRALLLQPNGEVVEMTEALLSTQYDADGAPSRIGMELYRAPDALPMRVAADRRAPAQVADGAERTAMAFRMEGFQGAGVFERISRS
jgi:hypothetical protein